MPDPLLSVDQLHVTYRRGSRETRAVQGVTFDLHAGRTLAVVGESGAGKSTVGAVVAGLVAPTSGSVEIEGQRVGTLGRAARRHHARLVQTVFQDPYNSLNPARTIGDTLCEPLTRVLGAPRAQAVERAAALLGRVGLDHSALRRYPAHFSGGQRQRIAIARALALKPRILVCDEPVSALDLSVQAQVLNLLVELQRDDRIALLFISHDLAVVRHLAHNVLIMRDGQCVESGPADDLLSEPKSQYAQELLLSAPVPDPREQAARRNRRLHQRHGQPHGQLWTSAQSTVQPTTGERLA